MILTANSRVNVRRGEAGDFTTFGLIPSGLGSWSLTDTAQTRPIPSLRAIAASQLLDVRSGTFGANFDDNATSAPLFFFASGEYFEVQVRPEGDTVGKQQIVVVGRARIQHSNPEGGIRGYRFDLTASGITYEVVA